jgi:hypothetical protein
LLLMRDPGDLPPPRSQSGRCPRLRPRSHGALKVWTVRVLLPVGIAPRDRGAGATGKALRSPKQHGLIASPPARRGARLRPVVGADPAPFKPPGRTRGRERSALVRTKTDSPFGTKITSSLPKPNPGKHVNSSTLEPNASTFSELLVHSGPFSTL